MKYAAVLFDLDGTIIETIPLWQRAYLGTLAQFGIKMSQEEFMQRVYIPRDSFIEVLKENNIIDPSELDRFRHERDEIYCEILHQSAEWLPGAKELIEQLRNQGILTGVITGSWRHYCDATDKRLGLYSYFDIFVTEGDVEHGKPDPSPLLLAAETLKVIPERCIYIGDMPFDIEAANRAGMVSCLVWGEHTPPGTDENANIVCNNLQEVTRVLQ